MIKSVFELLLIFHLLGDFFFQTEKMALEKAGKYRGVIKHSIIYVICFLGCMFVLFPNIPFHFLIIPGVAHAFIDSVKFMICKNVKDGKGVFLMDQILHLMTILIVVYYICDFNIYNVCNMKLKSVLDNLNIVETEVFAWILKLLVIHNPAYILIGKILGEYKTEHDSRNNEKNAGELVGTLERILMVIFVSIGQFSAVGFVLTAKSIARYDKISHDKKFAEYYLLGTLLSAIIAIVTALLI